MNNLTELCVWFGRGKIFIIFHQAYTVKMGRKYLKIETESDKLLISKLYKKIKYNVFGNSRRSKNNCFRVKYPKQYPVQKKICGINKILYHWTISYAHKYHKLLDGKRYPKQCISHLCGNAFDKRRKGKKWNTKRGEEMSLCCQASHLVIESNEDNWKRSKCHKCIRKFREHFYNNKQKYPQISTKGKLTINIIKQRLKNAKITDYIIDTECKHKNNKQCFIWYH